FRSLAGWPTWVPRWSPARQGVPSPTSYPAGQRPRHDPMFGSEELRGERRHSTSAALLGSPRLVPATAPSAPPDQLRLAGLARSVQQPAQACLRTAPSSRTPAVAYFQSATSSLRARATIIVLPRWPPVRLIRA